MITDQGDAAKKMRRIWLYMLLNIYRCIDGTHEIFNIFPHTVKRAKASLHAVFPKRVYVLEQYSDLSKYAN